MAASLEDMAASLETLTLQVKELSSSVDSETKARAGLSRDMARGFDRIFELIQTIQSPDGGKASSACFSVSSSSKRLMTFSESSFEMDICNEPQCGVSSRSKGCASVSAMTGDRKARQEARRPPELQSPF